MPELLTRWLFMRYLTLWKRYKEKEFTFDEAKKCLGDDPRVVSIFLSELKKRSWLNVRIDPEDSRKRLYSLRPHGDVHEEIAAGKILIKKVKQ